MPLHLQAKKLTETDLTILHWHFHHQREWRQESTKTAKQKAINLEKGLVEAAFPAIAAPAGWHKTEDRPRAWPGGKGRFGTPLTVYGPGGVGPHIDVDRSVSLEQKNWRLNGLIRAPIDDPERFKDLKKDDWVVVGIHGESTPTAAVLVFIDADHPPDQAIAEGLNERGSGEGAFGLTASDLEDLVVSAKPDPSHGIHALLPNAAEALDRSGAPPLPVGAENSRPSVHLGRMSPEDLDTARQQGRRIGELGEILVDAHLGVLVAAGEIEPYSWVSQDIADSPFDFESDPSGSPVRIEVKSTSGQFGASFYMSFNELLCVLDSASYHIYRVYGLDEVSERATLQVCRDAAGLAGEILEKIDELPSGVGVASIRISPDALDWDDPVELALSRD